MKIEEKSKKQLIQALKDGAIGVIPTDTVYGLVCGVFDKQAVERVYSASSRDSEKPLVVTLASKADLLRFGIKLDEKVKKVIESVWPGEVSVVVDCHCEHFKYLHRGRKSIAFRLPKTEELISILKETGPLATTSANPQGMPIPESIKVAKGYFGDNVDFYINGGHKKIVPSTIIRINRGGKVELLREGVVKVDIKTLNG